MTTPNKESTEATPRPVVDMDNPQDVTRMLSSGYGLSGEGFHYHSFTRPVMLDMTPELPHDSVDDTEHHLDDNVTEHESAPATAPVFVFDAAPEPAAPPVVAEAAPPPPPPPPPEPAPPEPPPAPPPYTPVVTHVPPPPPVEETPVPEPVAEAAAPARPRPVPPAQPAPDMASTGGRERRGLQPFTTPRTPSEPPVSSRAAAPATPFVQADDWAPVPKAQQRRGQRPTGPGFFFAKGNDRVATARLFQPVAVARPASKPDSKVTTMTKFDKTAQNAPTGRRPAPSDNSPTLTEVFMTLGGRATDRLVPKPSLRDALLRKREEETGQS